MATVYRMAAPHYRATLISEAGRHYLLSYDTQPESLDDAIAQVLSYCTHKCRLVIREAGDAGTRLHVYLIKTKGRPSFVGRVGEEQRFQPLQTEHVATINLDVL